MAAEDFTAFLARMAAPEGFTTQEFLKDLGEALLLDGALQSHEWTVANPSRVQRSFLRGKLGREIDLKFTPELHFHPDNSFDTASHVDALLNRPQVKQDLKGGPDPDRD